jgi:hypothetical protein
MKKWALLLVLLAVVSPALSSQGKPVIVVQPFTTAKDVNVPHDVKTLQAQGAGSSGTLGHPFAQKIAQRIKDANLK